MWTSRRSLRLAVTQPCGKQKEKPAASPVNVGPPSPHNFAVSASSKRSRLKADLWLHLLDGMRKIWSSVRLHATVRRLKTGFKFA